MESTYQTIIELINL